MLYNWIDRHLLYIFLNCGPSVFPQWFSLGEVWKCIEGVGNVAIIRQDGKIIYERKL